MIGTAQATFFTTTYFGGMFLVLGINPRAYYLKAKAMKDEEMKLISQCEVDVNGSIEDQLMQYARGPGSEGMSGDGPGEDGTFKEVFLIQMFKSMGLSDKTLLMVEQDLRS